MIVDEYLKQKYNYEIHTHNINMCSCDLSEGGKGLCLIGQYLNDVITAKEYLEVVKDKFANLQYGTVIRTELNDLARITNIETFDNDIFFILDRKVSNNLKDINSKSNKIRSSFIDNHSNCLKDIIEIGDFANGKKIIYKDKDKLWYGHWKNEFIDNEVTEVISKKDYEDKVIRI